MLQIFKRALTVAILSLMGCLLPATAHAQGMIEFRGWGIKNRGPAEAKGAILFQRGYAPRTPSRDEWELAPFLYRKLNEAGWDVFMAKVRYAPAPSQNVSVAPLLDTAYSRNVEYTQNKLQALRKQGYKNVIAAGHSFGGWATLNTLAKTPSLADRIIVSAPTRHGRAIQPNGKSNPLHYELKGESRAVFEKLKTPTFGVFAAGDEFEAPGRADAVQPILKKLAGSYIVNRPPAFSGHFAAWTPVFDYIYGDCLKAFIDGTDFQNCEKTAVSDSDFRSAVAYSAKFAEPQHAVTFDMIEKKKFVRYGLGQPSDFIHVASATEARIETVDDTNREKLAFTPAAAGKPAGICVGKTCGRLVAWEKQGFLEFDAKTDALKYWWVSE